MNGFSISQPEIHVRFIHFRTAGLSDLTRTGVSTLLGKSPHGRFFNSMELRFDVVGTPFGRYRFRRVLHEKIWQHVGGEFALLWSQPPGTPDHPDETSPGSTEPPELYDIDTPGLDPFASPGNRTFNVGAGDLLFSGRAGIRRESDPAALELIIKQQFQEWVEGRTEQGNWVRLSRLVDWLNVIRIQRPNPTANWLITPSTRIALGLIPMGNPFDASFRS